MTDRINTRQLREDLDAYHEAEFYPVDKSEVLALLDIAEAARDYIDNEGFGTAYWNARLRAALDRTTTQ